MYCCENRSEHKNTGTHIDPVCGMEVQGSNPELVTDYNGRKYYHCAENCMKVFSENSK